MIQAAKQKKFQIVLCKSRSRFTRDMELVEKYIHGLFPLWGIRFVAVADDADTEVKSNKKARQINGLVNEWYLEDLSENVRMVFDLKRREGKYIDTQESEWYRVEGTHEAIIDRATFDAVQRSLKLRTRADGSSEAHLLSGLVKCADCGSTMSKCSR